MVEFFPKKSLSSGFFGRETIELPIKWGAVGRSSRVAGVPAAKTLAIIFRVSGHLPGRILSHESRVRQNDSSAVDAFKWVPIERRRYVELILFPREQSNH